MARLRRSFNTDFKREAANLVLKEGYSVGEASRSLDIGETALRRWIDQLEGEGRDRPESGFGGQFARFSITQHVSRSVEGDCRLSTGF
jgi:transposase-like protein